MNAAWGDEKTTEAENIPDFRGVLSEIIENERNRITMVCLGGLSTAASALTEIPLFRQKVKGIIWSSEGIDDKKGFNYNIDARAVSTILDSGIPLTVVKGFDQLFYDNDLISRLSGSNSIYAIRLSEFLGSETARAHDYSYTLNDDAVPVFMHYPELFSHDTTRKAIETSPGDIGPVREKIAQILKGETVERNQVIKKFPVTPDFYFTDIEAAVTEIIIKYGMDEWTSGVIANELHRHLGVYAIIGVKMGIRAREYFNTGVDEFRVTSSAGSTPPLSCMNDGLQVSTGATPGHGLLTVINETPLSPSAEFIYMNRKIRLTLKPEIASMISRELSEINFVYGLDSDIYWELVRKNSIRYWLDLDRHDIFVIERL
jgi:pyrimidine-specific ribonucleoside hydrolase